MAPSDPEVARHRKTTGKPTTRTSAGRGSEVNVSRASSACRRSAYTAPCPRSTASHRFVGPVDAAGSTTWHSPVAGPGSGASRSGEARYHVRVPALFGGHEPTTRHRSVPSIPKVKLLLVLGVS